MRNCASKRRSFQGSQDEQETTLQTEDAVFSNTATLVTLMFMHKSGNDNNYLVGVN
jgi:hypothetical protein